MIQVSTELSFLFSCSSLYKRTYTHLFASLSILLHLLVILHNYNVVMGRFSRMVYTNIDGDATHCGTMHNGIRNVSRELSLLFLVHCNVHKLHSYIAFLTVA